MRPYWLMKILSKTIRDGGYLTPKIYVPKSVWYEHVWTNLTCLNSVTRFQYGVKISAIQTKSASWEAINESLLKIKEIPKEDEALGKVCTIVLTNVS